MTPETLSAVLNPFIPLGMVAVGIVVKYVPAFRKVSNQTIPYINVVLAFLVQILAPQAANAGIPGAVGLATVGVADAVVKSFVHSILARQLYEGFLRAVLTNWLVPSTTPVVKRK